MFSRNEGGGFYLAHALYEPCVQIYKPVVKFKYNQIKKYKCNNNCFVK